MKLITKLRAASNTRQQMRASVRAMLLEAADELESLERTFDLRWDADMRAIRRWQAAHPGNGLVWPDHADMVVWLLHERDEYRASKSNAKATDV